jgi:hypothetical protein
LLVHPFHSRGRTGFDALFTNLTRNGEAVRFVSGNVSNAGDLLTIRPILVVWDDGLRRVAVQPYIDNAGVSGGSAERAACNPPNSAAADPLAAFLQYVRFELSELILTGIRRAGAGEAKRWADLSQQGQQLGFVRLADPPAQLAELLAARTSSVRWDPTPVLQLVLELLLLARIGSDC